MEMMENYQIIQSTLSHEQIITYALLRKQRFFIFRKFIYTESSCRIVAL